MRSPLMCSVQRNSCGRVAGDHRLTQLQPRRSHAPLVLRRRGKVVVVRGEGQQQQGGVSAPAVVAEGEAGAAAPPAPVSPQPLAAPLKEGPSTDFAVILARLKTVGAPGVLPEACALRAGVRGRGGWCAPLLRLPPRPHAPSRPPQLALPYWTESDERVSARWKLAGVFALTLGTTGVRWGGGGWASGGRGGVHALAVAP